MTPTDHTADPGNVPPSTSSTPPVSPGRAPQAPATRDDAKALPDSRVNPGPEKEPVARTVPPAGPGTPVDGAPRPPAKGEQKPPVHEEPRSMSTTRAAAAWLATAVSLVILVLLIILILENQQTVRVTYLGLQGSLPLGTALLIAAVAGGAIVTIVGVVRLTQLRIMARRARRREAARLEAKG